MSEQLLKYKIIDYFAVLIDWVIRSTVARNWRAEKLWRYLAAGELRKVAAEERNLETQELLCFTRRKPNTENDETDFRRKKVESFEDASDLMCDVSIEDIAEELSNAVRVNLNHSEKEAELWRNQRNTNNEAERNLRGHNEEELMLATREMPNRSKKYRARRITQEVQRVKNNQLVGHAQQCEEDGLATRDKPKWKNELERCLRKRCRDDDEKKARREIDEWEGSGQENDWEGENQDWQCQFSCKSILMQITAFFWMGKRLGLMVIRLTFWSPFCGGRCRRSERFWKWGTRVWTKKKLKRCWKTSLYLFRRKRSSIMSLIDKRWICVQSALDKWCCGRLTIMLEWASLWKGQDYALDFCRQLPQICRDRGNRCSTLLQMLLCGIFRRKLEWREIS